jgi:internalin A
MSMRLRTRILGACGLLFTVACDQPAPTTTTAAKEVTPTPVVAVKPTVAATPSAAPSVAPVSASEIECKAGGAVDFHDKVLEDEVRRKLQKPEGEIKKSELSKIKSINLAKGAPVDYLDPCVFPHLTGVKDLFLGPGKLSDLRPVAKLSHLTSLRAAANAVTDISPLSSLKALDRLDLANTAIDDVKPLATLTNLTDLQLDGTQVKDVSALVTLTKLERLSLQRTQVKDVSALKALSKLKFLYLQGTSVDNPAAANHPGLKILTD